MKIKTGIGLFLLTSTIGLGAWARSTDGQMSEQELRTFYFATNRVYFDGILPADINIKWVRDLKDAKTGEPLAGETTCNGIVDGPVLGCEIKMDTVANRYENAAKMTMYHEECHIKLWVKKIKYQDDHGNEFQSCMKILAQQDAFKDNW